MDVSGGPDVVTTLRIGPGRKAGRHPQICHYDRKLGILSYQRVDTYYFVWKERIERDLFQDVPAKKAAVRINDARWTERVRIAWSADPPAAVYAAFPLVLNAVIAGWTSGTWPAAVGVFLTLVGDAVGAAWFWFLACSEQRNEH